MGFFAIGMVDPMNLYAVTRNAHFPKDAPSNAGAEQLDIARGAIFYQRPLRGARMHHRDLI